MVFLKKNIKLQNGVKNDWWLSTKWLKLCSSNNLSNKITVRYLDNSDCKYSTKIILTGIFLIR